MLGIFSTGCFVQDFMALMLGFGIGCFCTSFFIMPRMMMEEIAKG